MLNICRFGGVGGQGGDIYFVAKDGLTLENVLSKNRSKRIQAPHGRDSTHNFILGIPGEKVEIPVPVGVTVETDLGKKLGSFLRDKVDFDILCICV